VNEDCLKLTAYFGERQMHSGRFYADVLLDLFGTSEVATSILLRGSAGFGLRHHLRTDESLSMSEDPPVVALAVDSRERIERVVEQLDGWPGRGMLTLERARLVQDEIGHLSLPEKLHEATKLTVYVGRQERVRRTPAFLAVCELLHREGVAGASVFLGVDGTSHGQRQRAGFFDRNAHVPAMVISVGAGERIAAVLPELGALLSKPLITLERVRVCKRDGILLQRPYALPNVDQSGLGIWLKLMVYTSESELYEGQPIHRALVRRLRASSSARGCTALRGIWGFHGDHAPHGDTFFQLGRRVPVTTIMVDTPERISHGFDIVNELTAEHGLVTAEMVPAARTMAEAGPTGGMQLSDYEF
jgi:PII-like signaling protein